MLPSASLICGCQAIENSELLAWTARLIREGTSSRSEGKLMLSSVNRNALPLPDFAPSTMDSSLSTTAERSEPWCEARMLLSTKIAATNGANTASWCSGALCRNNLAIRDCSDFNLALLSILSSPEPPSQSKTATEKSSLLKIHWSPGKTS